MLHSIDGLIDVRSSNASSISIGGKNQKSPKKKT